MSELKTLKDIKSMGKSPKGNFMIEENELKAKAIKWVKEDIKLLKTLTIPELRKIAEIDLDRWMYRLNITEEDLK